MTARANGEMGSNKAGLLADLPLADPVCLCEFMAGRLRGEIRLCFIAQQASPAIIASPSPPSVLRDISSHPARICSICSSRPGLVNWIRLQYCSMSSLPVAKMYCNLFFLYAELRASIDEGGRWMSPDMRDHSRSSKWFSPSPWTTY